MISCQKHTSFRIGGTILQPFKRQDSKDFDFQVTFPKARESKKRYMTDAGTRESNVTLFHQVATPGIPDIASQIHEKIKSKKCSGGSYHALSGEYG